ncbi:hypothetical protein FQN52_001142 [Onygenales sp. PD_12]|nr:hypothetical protein FQN52_001142 [Onygenales sp. PD_12]
MPPCFPRSTLLSTSAFLHARHAPPRRLFSRTAGLRAESRNPTHYETLNVPITATTAEIKKKFYALSLAHHPDRNPEDPTAHGKFASISSAYHILSHTARRARYDRDNDIHRPVAAPEAASQQRNSSYVGSRPPSGLNKKRGPFRGPPPSFYAHGGYGAGRQNHQSQTADSSSSASGTSSSSYYDPAHAFKYNNPVYHFDAASHFRTQMHEDERRRARRNKAVEREKSRIREYGGLPEEDAADSLNVRFFAILAIVGMGALAASLGQAFAPSQPPLIATPRKNQPGRRVNVGQEQEKKMS